MWTLDGSRLFSGSGSVKKESVRGFNMNYTVNYTVNFRWDTFAVLWEPLLSHVPLLGCIGNHELGMNIVWGCTASNQMHT